MVKDLETSKIRVKTRLSAVSTSIQHCIGNSKLGNYARNRKGIKIGKKKSKIISGRWHELYVENPKDATKKLLELSWAGLQDTKSIYRNQLYFLLWAIQKWKLRKQCHLQ